MEAQRVIAPLMALLAMFWPHAPSGHSVADRLPRPGVGKRRPIRDLRLSRPAPLKPHFISDVRLSPSRPASLSHSEEVKITFNYSTSHQDGVRIFLRPMSGEQPSPNYQASGSPLYPMGKGSGTGLFTISTGDVMVDSIRFEIKTEDQKLLRRQIIPVKYRFSDDPFRGGAAGASTHHIRPDGVLEVTKPDGSVALYDSDGRRGWRDPQTGVEKWHIVSLIDLTPPVTADGADAAWVERLNNWLNTVGDSMLGSIERLAGDPNSFKNYTQHEDKECQSLYQRIDMRQSFLSVLLQGLQ